MKRNSSEYPDNNSYSPKQQKRSRFDSDWTPSPHRQPFNRSISNSSVNNNNYNHHNSPHQHHQHHHHQHNSRYNNGNNNYYRSNSANNGRQYNNNQGFRHFRYNNNNSYNNGDRYNNNTNSGDRYNNFLDPFKNNSNSHTPTSTTPSTPSISHFSFFENDPFAKATAEILDYYSKNTQTFECYQKKYELRNALYAMFQDIIPYIGVYIVGSSTNGFGTTNSDVDMCLMVSSEEIDQKTEASLLLRILSKSLRKADFIRNLQMIPAKVPIIKFHDRYGKVDCDLNVNNHNGIRNTHLMKYYSEMDARVKPFVLMVKRWAKFHDINDAAKQTISSYSLVLMALFYLQNVCNPPIVPVLQELYPAMFHVNSDVKTLSLSAKLDNWSSSNQTSLGELFLGFLRYYANFDYKNNVISVRTGKLIPVSNYVRKSDEGAYPQWKFLCIEEPFELTNTARSVYDYYVFQRIIRVFKKSYEVLSETKDVHAVLREAYTD